VLQAFGPGWIDLRALGAAGFVIALLSSTLLTDFFLYVLHRLQHASDILWQEHLLHHCDENVNVTTASRSHILDIVLTAVFVTIPMSLLFRLEPVEIALLAMLSVAWNYFAHANLRVSFGPLWWLATSPQYHRIHHSLEARHRDRNFAVWFPLWDIMFGTAYRPLPGEYPATGVEGVRVETIPDAYLQPFRGWRRMLASRKRGAPNPAADGSVTQPRRP
jgi:sterol desaturase/sphingolipid hydroxylase (fatty acid hydroxylase superfamily)